MEVVSLVYGFFRAGASRGDSLRPRVREPVSDRRATAREVERASSEVIRARDATHSAIALRSAPTGGST